MHQIHIDNLLNIISKKGLFSLFFRATHNYDYNFTIARLVRSKNFLSTKSNSINTTDMSDYFPLIRGYHDFKKFAGNPADFPMLVREITRLTIDWPREFDYLNGRIA